MIRPKLSFVIGILLLSKLSFAQSSAAIREYIATYKEAAIEDMKHSGVPAAITLAQGIHETEAGKSDLVLMSNNHFGIKCKSDWKGETVSHDDDAKGECFRKYTSALDSYRDHSEFLHSSSRYAFLFQLDPTDYEGWAWGLKKAGYATNPKYPQILIRLIKDYNLEDYTLIALGRKSPVEGEMLASVDHPKTDNQEGVSGPAVNIAESSYPDGIFKINDTKVVFVPKGTSFLSIAEQYDISLRRLFEFNDMQPQDITTADGLIYLQRKRKSGNNEFHKVMTGENLYSIAQAEAIRMESLLEYNFLKEGMQPQVNEVLYLQKQAPSMPKLAQSSAYVTAKVDEVTAATSPAIPQLQIESNNTTSQYAYVMHRVQPKETVYSIAKKYAVTLDDVLKWNDLQRTDLKIGQELRINKKGVNGTN